MVIAASGVILRGENGSGRPVAALLGPNSFTPPATS